ncbi:MAG: hypothetical protein PHS79_04675 [Patescibacteria group bacterium]|nr:hypothetical protein [Patescibacteria group bacterium]
MKCKNCTEEIIDDECACPKCKEPMICENGVCHCSCGAALPEDQCVCTSCAQS